MDTDIVCRQKVGRGIYTNVLRVVKNVTWQKHITYEVLCTGLPRISTTIRERRLRFNGRRWRSQNEVVSGLVLWEPISIAKVATEDRPAHLLIYWRRKPGSPETA